MVGKLTAGYFFQVAVVTFFLPTTQISNLRYADAA
jgi:hypothetical protein